ncbi:MAG TPA: ABC transporter permease [Candidatus Anammoximicrobium sp.]|nr:ABC transporter permease [Candidatus Anammoximicrobium sp.]
MSIWSMMLHEIAYRKVNFLLGLAGTAAAIALLVGVLTGLQFHVVRSDEIVSRKEEETKAVMIGLRSDLRQAMQRLGYNAIVLPKDQPLGDWYAEDYGAITMPESWAPKLDETRELVDRYQPRLRRKLKWEERQWTILVVGVGPERVLDTSVGEAAPLADSIPRGSCVVGYELHYALGLEPGQEIAVLGRVFRIDKCERELGTKDDISIWIPLADAQQMLNQPGAINEILIVEHLSVWGNLAEVRRRMAAVLPDCQVVEIASETMSRTHARIKVAEEAQAAVEEEREKRALLQAERRNAMTKLVPLGFLACAVWIGLLMYVNVRERAPEIGVLRAIGFRAGDVRTLVFSKACVLGIAGGLAGFALGTAGAMLLEGRVHAVAALGWGIALEQLGLAQAMGIAACVLGSWLPARVAAALDPAEILHER